MIKNSVQYKAIMERVDELSRSITNDTPIDSKEGVEFSILVDLVEEYEDKHFPVGPPVLGDVLKLRMYERSISQKDIAEMLGISTSRVSEYITGKAEPTLKIAREISKKLDIDPSIVLGVC